MIRPSKDAHGAKALTPVFKSHFMQNLTTCFFPLNEADNYLCHVKVLSFFPHLIPAPSSQSFVFIQMDPH